MSNPSKHVQHSGLLLSDCSIASRGDNGELRVGVRRAMRQQTNVPSSVISSHSMHLGVLATAWHAVNTGTMFTVYYKPRYVAYALYYMQHITLNKATAMYFGIDLKHGDRL